MHPSTTTTTENFIFIATSLCLAYLVSLAAQFLGYYRLPQHVEKTHLTFYDVGAAFAIFLSIPLGLVPSLFVGWRWIEIGHFPSTDELVFTQGVEGWMNIVMMGLTTVGMLLFCWVLKKSKRRSIFRVHAFDLEHVPTDLMMGAATWLIAFPVVAGVGQLAATISYWFVERIPLEQVAVKQLKASLNDPFLFWIVTLSVVIIVPFLEEFIFRGCLQTWLKQRFGMATAIAFTAIVFALFHFSPAQGMGNIELIVSLTILGGYLGFIYERQQSLWASYTLHAVFNAISTMLISLE